MSAPRRDPRPGADDRGVTLVELLVVVALVVVVGGASTALVITGSRVQRATVATGAALDQARIAADRVQREVRAARRVDQCTARTLQLWIDRDADSTVDTDEQVFYELPATGNRLERWTAAAPARRRVAAHVRSDAVPAFACNTTARTVVLNLSVDQQPTQPPPPLPLTVTVRLRNG